MKTITLRKGLDIRLEGAAQKQVATLATVGEYAVQPADFEGVTPKLLVKAGDTVEAGGPLFFDKARPEVVFTSPVSGVVKEIRRGAKRIVEAVVVEADATQRYRAFDKLDATRATREELTERLLDAGLWPMIMQRPYGVIANPNDTPKAIFVSLFDTAPLAPDYDVLLKDERHNLQTGIDVLRRMTDGKVHVGIRPTSARTLQHVEYHAFKGPHPAGNVGVQIHHVSPVAKGEVVWTVNAQDLAIIGRFFNEGRVDMTRTIAVTGSEIKTPQYYRVVTGTSVKPLLEGNLKHSTHLAVGGPRVISGHVLTGRKTKPTGFVGFYANQLTVIPEGNRYEMFGWMKPRFDKFSVSRSYFSWLMPKRAYNLDTNMNGGERAFVVTGLYDRYLPMDVYPMYLLKACLAGDIDKMEGLGIYEVVEEDFALCEFVDPSKTEMQQIIRNGINLMIREA